MSNNSSFLISQYVPGIYPAILVDCERASGLYGNYYNFSFEVKLSDNQKATALYRTSTKFVADSPHGPSSFYQLVKTILSPQEMDEFEDCLDFELLLFRKCEALVEKDIKTDRLIITRIFLKSDHQ